MARPRWIAPFTTSGALFTGSPAQVLAWDLAGNVRTPPTVTHYGGNFHAFTPTDADENVGTVVRIDWGATALPRWTVHAVFKPDNSNQFAAVLLTNPDDTILTGSAAPSWAGYKDVSGNRTAPSWVSVPAGFTTGIYVATPSVSDIAAHPVRGLAQGSGSVPYWSLETLPLGGAAEGTLPVITNVTPASGSTITPGTEITFDVTDAGGNLESTNVFVYYPALQKFDVLFFGAISGAWGSRPEGFAPEYTGTRTAITNGFHFTVTRRGGWPSRPVIVIDPDDAVGNEAAP